MCAANCITPFGIFMCFPIFPLSVQHVLLRRRCFHTFFLSNQFIFLPDRCSTPSITYHHLSSLECLKPSTFAHLISELNRSLILHFNSQFLVSLLQSSRENSTVFYFFGWGNRMNVFQKGGCIISGQDSQFHIKHIKTTCIW